MEASHAGASVDQRNDSIGNLRMVFARQLCTEGTRFLEPTFAASAHRLDAMTVSLGITPASFLAV